MENTISETVVLSEAAINESPKSQQESETYPSVLRNVLLARSEFLVTATILAILAALLFPLSGKAVDVLLVFNISLTAALIVISLLAKSPAELGGFPLLLIFTTLMRLILSVATSKTMLLGADAGIFVGVTGDFLVQGDALPVVAIFSVMAGIIFALICKITRDIRRSSLNFAVEVVPVKKLSVETDLNAGIIDNQQAHELRERIDCQSRFFGAMGAAGRFILFDGVITLIIISVNLAGGLALSCMDSVRSAASPQGYAGLAVGAGLIAQVPAFFIAAASRRLLGERFFKAGQNKAAVQFHDILHHCQHQERACVERLAKFEACPADSEQADAAKESPGRDEFYDRLAKQIECIAFEKSRIILLAAPKTAGLAVTTAVNVAMHFAQKGQRSLLVDADAARDAVAKVFDIGGESADGGLKAVVKTCVENLWVWPGKTFARHNTMTLSRKIGRLRTKFHRIIIYAPNVEATPACEQLAGCAQAAILFVPEDSNENPSMTWLRERLEASGCEILC